MRWRAYNILPLFVFLALLAPLNMLTSQSQEGPPPRQASLPIIIDGDQDLTDTASDMGWPGDGSKDSPYIIDGLTIDADGMGACIYLGNSSLHLTVRNCSVTGTTPRSSYMPGAGLVLWDCTNVTILNCTARGNLFGAYAMASSSCKIINCTLRNTRNDLALIYSDDNILHGNDLKGSTEGLMLQSSNGNTITSNVLSFSSDLSMEIFESKENDISGNIFHNNTGEAYIYLSDHNTVNDNTFNDNNIGLKVSWSPYNSVNGNLFERNDLALYMVNSVHNTIFDPTMMDNKKGVHLYYSDYNDLVLGWIDRSDIAIHIEHSKNNEISGIVISDPGEGISIEGDSDRNVIRSCNIAGSEILMDRGIRIVTSEGWDNRLLENTVSNCYIGIEVSLSDMTWVRDNTIFSCTKGILFWDPSRSNATDNKLSDCITGIECQWSEGLVYDRLILSGNLIKDCTGEGIFAEGSGTENDMEELVIISGRIDQCGKGIDVRNSSNERIEGNYLRSNGIGLSFQDCQGYLVFDNYLNNTQNVVLKYAEGTVWNITRVPETNIVFGPYKGGNYWSDYNGSDLDGDGLGDEFLPHGPGDYHPLVRDTVTPIITDLTSGTPETGGQFRMIAMLEDRPAPQELDVLLDYEVIGLDGSKLESGRSAQKHWKESTFSKVITVHREAALLRYRFIATDRAGNSEGTFNESPVKDVIAPNVTLAVNDMAATGGDIEVNLTVMENIMMGSVEVQYSLPGGPAPYGDETFDLGGRKGTIYLLHKVPIPSNTTEVLLTAKGVDLVGNVMGDVNLLVNVTDTIPPEIADLDIDVVDDGLKVSFRAVIIDNIGVVGAMVEATWSGGRTVTLPLAHSNGSWTITIPIPLDANHLRWSMSAWDPKGNVALETGGLDIIPPLYAAVSDLTIGSPMTGVDFDLVFEERRNLDSVDRLIEWWFGNGDNGSFQGATDHTVKVPEAALSLEYRFTVWDGYGAKAFVEGALEVLDIIPPSIHLLADEAANGQKAYITWSVNDNIAVGESYVLYRFDGLEWEVGEAAGQTLILNVPLNVSVMELEGHVKDDALIENTTYLLIDVIDPLGPMVSLFEGRFDEENDTFVLTAMFQDNRGPGTARVNWTMGGIEKERLDLVDAWGSAQTVVLDLDGFEGELRFTVVLIDKSGNIAGPTPFSYVIERNEVVRESEIGLFLIIALIIAIIVVLLAAIYIWSRGRNAPPVEE